MARVSIDSAPWREETMIGWVVRFDGTWKRRIVRLGFHPTQLFNPSPPQRVPLPRALSTNRSVISPQAAHTGERNDKHVTKQFCTRTTDG